MADMGMTEQQIIETLATKVMGWKQIPHRPSGPPEVFPVFYLPVHGDIKDGCIVAYKDENGVIDTSHWNPLQNIADAWQVVERYPHYKMQSCVNGQKYCELLYEGRLYGDHGDSQQEAICSAALKVIT